jgi:hypothetical protein
MTQLRPPAVTVRAWRGRVEQLGRVAGPFPAELEASWRVELDAVQERMPAAVRAADGVHALLVLAGARVGGGWEPGRLLDLAAAVELAHHAIRLHAGVGDGPPGNRARRARNIERVLEGDLAITQAALLAADVGPVAYQRLVRGFGSCQVASLVPCVAPVHRIAPLAAVAFGLGALVAGVPEIPRVPDRDSPVRRVWQWVLSPGGPA